MAPTLLSALSTRGDPPTIKVKVLRIWDSVNLSTNEIISVDMILTDKKVCLLSIYVISIVSSILLYLIYICIYPRAIPSMLLLGTNCSTSLGQKLEKIPSTY
jgi:hypothetical protein